MGKHFFAAILLATSFSFAATTNSEKYSAFNEEGAARKAFVLSQNAKVNARLEKSPNREKIEVHLRTRVKADKLIKRIRLADGARIVAVDKGLHLAQEVAYLPKEGDPQVLFSTFDIAKNNKFKISNLYINPAKSKLGISVNPDGSKDDSFLYIIDLATKKMDVMKHFYHGRSIFWKSDTEVIFKDISTEGSTLIKSLKIVADAAPVVETLYTHYDLETSTSASLFISSQLRDHIIILSRDRAPIEMSGLSGCMVEGEYNGKIYCTKRQYQNGQTYSDLMSFTLDDTQLRLERSIPGNLTLTYLGETFFAYVDQSGFQKMVYHIDFATNQTNRLAVPDYVSVTNFYETENQGELEISFVGDLNSKDLIWKPGTNNLVFDDANFKKEMLEDATLSLQVDFIFVKSFDGTPVPVRIVYEKATRPSKAPVLMEAYGGFDSSGYLDPGLESMAVEFIRRGGVYVGPGIRGGNEFGKGWHESGIKKNKIKTYEDLASVAKYLIDSGISEKSKIAIAGTSNGGLTVAATGLLFPQYFGLVMATNGVLDLMSKQQLDQRFNGWASDYGDPRNPEDAENLLKISPLEQVARAENGPAFVIFNGRKDTRVNPAHSIKFAKAADDLKAAGKNVNVELYSINNAGHGMVSPDNDYIGIRAGSYFWTQLFDQFGMSF
ncbi:MAG: family peptidase [Pseudobdellovibrio sp.]|jgi:prolyl oligopeptidase PreP (S9A serine peptidase family)|nr:family peptidase [Pseudobdellovibrio sp.]